MTDIVVAGGSVCKTVAWLKSRKVVKIRFFKEEIQVQGTVYLGRVASIAKGLDSAFVDIGLEKPGFLHFRDFPLQQDGKENGAGAPRLKVGDSVLVQVTKEPVGDKGAKLTGYIDVRGLRGVLLPFEKGVNVSKGISPKAERLRLKQLAESMLPRERGYGLILRTLSAGMDETAMQGMISSLQDAWEQIKRTAAWAYPPKVMLRGSWTDQILEELLRDTAVQVHVNDAALYDALLRRLGQEERRRLFLSSGDVLSDFGIRSVMEELLERQMPLASGGYLTLDLTEALTLYDVNSGTMVTEDSLEKTALKLNTEAVERAMDHMVLADIGGMVLVDLVEAGGEKTQEKLLQMAIEKGREKDEAILVHGITKLGLLEMTRKRQGESFYGTMGKPCHLCEGLGIVKSADWLFQELVDKLQGHMAEGFDQFQILTEGLVPRDVQMRLEAHLALSGAMVSWECVKTLEKFTYRIRPFRQKKVDEE